MVPHKNQPQSKMEEAEERRKAEEEQQKMEVERGKKQGVNVTLMKPRKPIAKSPQKRKASEAPEPAPKPTKKAKSAASVLKDAEYVSKTIKQPSKPRPTRKTRAPIVEKSTDDDLSEAEGAVFNVHTQTQALNTRSVAGGADRDNGDSEDNKIANDAPPSVPVPQKRRGRLPKGTKSTAAKTKATKSAVSKSKLAKSSPVKRGTRTTATHIARTKQITVDLEPIKEEAQQPLDEESPRAVDASRDQTETNAPATNNTSGLLANHLASENRTSTRPAVHAVEEVEQTGAVDVQVGEDQKLSNQTIIPKFRKDRNGPLKATWRAVPQSSKPNHTQSCIPHSGTEEHLEEAVLSAEDSDDSILDAGRPKKTGKASEAPPQSPALLIAELRQDRSAARTVQEKSKTPAVRDEAEIGESGREDVETVQETAVEARDKGRKNTTVTTGGKNATAKARAKMRSVGLTGQVVPEALTEEAGRIEKAQKPGFYLKTVNHLYSEGEETEKEVPYSKLNQRKRNKRRRRQWARELERRTHEAREPKDRYK